MPANTEREMKLEAKALLDKNEEIEAKGENVTPDEVAEHKANRQKVAELLEKITAMSLAEGSKEVAGYKASLSALLRSDRPALGGADPSGGPLQHQYFRNERWAVKSLGETLVESEAYKAFKPSMQGSMSVEIPNMLSLAGHTKTTFSTSAATLTGYERPPGIVMLEQQRLTVADLLGQGTTNLPTIRYVKEDTYTNAATTVAEGGTKPEAAFDTSEVDAPVRKIAVTAKVTDELYSDFPAMQSYIDGRLRFMVGTTEEAQLLNGDGNSPNLTGILQTSGIQTQGVSTDTVLDAIHKAVTKIRAVGFFEPDAIVMHPTDYQIIRLAKDGNLNYFGGGPFMGPYGNGSYPGYGLGPWGLRAVVTTAISAGTALVGAFKMGAMVFRREGVTVQMTNSNEDDFKKNLIAIRAEERLALAVWRPKAFCTVTSIA